MTRSRVGHGALGLRDGLRDMVELLEGSSVERHGLVEIRPGRIVTGWYLHTGATYVAPLEEIHGGITRDVVAVATGVDPRLTRAETLAACVATAGTFYYDADTPSSARSWDDALPWWDESDLSWDAFPQLYVHLSDGSSPALTTVRALLAFHAAGRGVVHPQLGPELLTDAGFEAGTGWTDTVPGGAEIARQQTMLRGPGAWGLHMATNAAGSALPTRAKVLALASAGVYRLCASYLVPEGSTRALRILVGTGSSVVDVEGRDYGTDTTAPLLGRTHGEWRRFAFDFRAPSAGPTLTLDFDPAGTGQGEAYLDGISLRRVWRWVCYEPRLQTRGLPSTESGKNDVWFGNQRVGVGRLAMLIADGNWLTAMGALDWPGAEVLQLVGGAHADGQELLLDDHRTSFTATAQSPTATDRELQVDLQDVRAVLHRKVPTAVYSAFDLPGMDTRAEGKPRAMLWGAKSGISPVRTELVGVYGRYEVAYTTGSPAGLKAIVAVYAYADEDAGRDRLAARRVTLTAAVDYSADLSTGSVTVLRDVGIREVVAGASDRLDFDIGASALVAMLTPGVYTAAGIAAHAAAALTTAAATAIGLAYSDATHLFTSSKASGTLSLLLGTGANKDRSGWKLLGYTASSDRTGVLTYDSDAATFTSPDQNHILRVDAQGYADDAAGTYTGTPSALIQKGPDVVRYVWRRVLGLDLALVDTGTFLAARTSAPDALGVYLGGAITTRDVLQRIEISCLSDVVIDGEGRIYFDVYSNATPADTPSLQDRDFIAFSSRKGLTDLYGEIRVEYDHDPATGTPRVRTSTNSAVAVRYGTGDPRPFPTYHTSGDDAQVRALELATLAAAAPLVLTVTLPARLIDRRPGTKVLVTRSRVAFAPGGGLTDAPFRILSLKPSWLAGAVEAVLVEHVDLPRR